MFCQNSWISNHKCVGNAHTIGGIESFYKDFTAHAVFTLIKDSMKLTECLWCFLSNDIVSTSE